MEKVKREDGSVACWVTTVIFIAWNILWIGMWKHDGFYFKLDGATFTGTSLILLVSFVLGAFLWMAVIGDEKIRTTEFIIFEFKVWEKSKMEYVTRYDYGNTVLFAKFLYNWEISQYTQSTTTEEIKRRYNNDGDYYQKESFIGYTKEQVMEQIREWAIKMLASKKVIENVKIVDITTNEVITVEDLVASLKDTPNE